MNYTISNLLDSDKEELLELADEVFKSSGMDNKSYISNMADWSISIKLIDNETNKIIGFYIFNQQKQRYIEKYTGPCLHGVALGIDPDYKNKGIGKMLINYPIDNMGDRFNYIWGMHLKYLGNIEDWKKKREVISESSGMYITAGFLKKNN